MHDQNVVVRANRSKPSAIEQLMSGKCILKLESIVMEEEGGGVVDWVAKIAICRSARSKRSAAERNRSKTSSQDSEFLEARTARYDYHGA